MGTQKKKKLHIGRVRCTKLCQADGGDGGPSKAIFSGAHGGVLELGLLGCARAGRTRYVTLF